MEHTEFLCLFFEDADAFNYVYARVTSTSQNGIWKKGHIVAHLRSEDDTPNDIEVVMKRPGYISKRLTMSFKKGKYDTDIPDITFYVNVSVYQLFKWEDIRETHQIILREIEEKFIAPVA